MLNQNSETKMINVAHDFSRFPGGRFITDGQYSGERFREEILVPALKGATRVVVNLDGTLGYGSSFLEEAFGGLVRESGFDSRTLLEKLDLKTSDQSLAYTIKRYIQEAKG